MREHLRMSGLEKLAVVASCLVLSAGAWFWVRQIMAAIELLQMAQG